jgi:hypothetical protein
MSIIPSRAELGKFFDHHPILGTFIFISAAFTGFETVRAITAPKGQGPFSGLGGSYSPNYMTRSTLSSMEQDVKSLRNRIDTNAKVPDWAESYIYTAGDRINSVDDYMTHRSGLGGSTSTTTSTSTSHRGFRRPMTQDIMIPRQINASDFFGVPTQALANLGSANLPPAMRRRVNQRQRGTASLGNAGVQPIDVADNMDRSGYNSMSDLYGLNGIVPQPGSGWTE